MMTISWFPGPPWPLSRPQPGSFLSERSSEQSLLPSLSESPRAGSGGVMMLGKTAHEFAVCPQTDRDAEGRPTGVDSGKDNL